MDDLRETVLKSRLDVEAALAVLHADVDMTFPVLSGVGRWFPDVPVRIPAPEMELAVDERRSLAIQILEEMADVFDEAMVLMSDGKSVSTEQLSQSLNPLWRELTGVFAPVLNMELAPAVEAAAEAQAERLDMVFRVIGSMTGLDEDEIREQAKSSERLRSLLVKFGIDPDAL